MSQRTVLVTGAFGQVGWRTAEILLQRGYTVVATDLPTDTSRTVAARLAAAAHPGTLLPVYADLTDADAVKGMLTEHSPSAIVHLAAMLSPASYRNPKLARRVNVGGTTNLSTAQPRCLRRRRWCTRPVRRSTDPAIPTATPS